MGGWGQRRVAVFVGLCAVAVVLPLGAATAATVAVPTSIDATGRTDATAKLNTFFNSVPDFSTITFKAGSKYRIDGTVRIVSKQGLTIVGNGALLFATTKGDRDRAHVRLNRSTGVTIRKLTVRGANPNAGMADSAYNPNYEAQHGF